VAVSSSLARRIATYEPRTRIHTIGNVIDTGFFAPADDVERTIALTVAPTLDESKGTDLLLQAWRDARLRTALPPLVVVGADPGARYARLAAELGLGDDVTFTGRVTRDRVRELLHQARFYVSASRFETFGVALAEALATGVPVLSTRCGGPEDFVSSEVGMLVVNEDVHALEDGIVKIAEAAPSFEPARLHTHIASRFGADAFLEQMFRVYAGAGAT
jgi:glycosyltransferase involved in cell wall biosynthesis